MGPRGGARPRHTATRSPSAVRVKTSMHTALRKDRAPHAAANARSIARPSHCCWLGLARPWISRRVS